MKVVVNWLHQQNFRRTWALLAGKPRDKNYSGVARTPVNGHTVYCEKGETCPTLAWTCDLCRSFHCQSKSCVSVYDSFKIVSLIFIFQTESNLARSIQMTKTNILETWWGKEMSKDRCERRMERWRKICPGRNWTFDDDWKPDKAGPLPAKLVPAKHRQTLKRGLDLAVLLLAVFKRCTLCARRDTLAQPCALKPRAPHGCV